MPSIVGDTPLAAARDCEVVPHDTKTGTSARSATAVQSLTVTRTPCSGRGDPKTVEAFLPSTQK
jgi:hypothetical protein